MVWLEHEFLAHTSEMDNADNPQQTTGLVKQLITDLIKV